MDDRSLLAALEPTAESLYERHLSTAKEWFPHDLVPWGQAADFEPGWVWDEESSPLPDAVRSALFVNLLTEDNLPYYFQSIDGVFGADNVWGSWNRRWTAEEGRHAIVIRDYITVTRSLDPVALERGRMAQVSGGITPQPVSPCDTLAYVALQELATRIAHRNTGKLLEDRPGYEVMARVAADENLHYLFYRDLATAAMAVDPSEMVCAIDRQVRAFEMPGTGIPDFTTHAMRIAKAGIYDFAAHHDQILVPVVLQHWKLASVEGLSPEAEEARARVLKYIDRVGIAARRASARRAESDSVAAV
jgi:acyl-[acyl-carrier-protein] desaturase